MIAEVAAVVVAVAYAVVKHVGLAKIKAEVKAVVAKVETAADADVKAIVADLKKYI